MKRVLGIIVLALLCTGPVESSASQGKSQKGKKAAPHASSGHDGGGSGMAVHVVFSSREGAVIRQHYAPRYRSLPPGLQKKLARTGQLPPGWQKKMEPFPQAIERQLVPLPDGYRRGVIDGHAVIYNPRTQVIVDLVVLF